MAVHSSIWTALARTQIYIDGRKYSNFIVGEMREPDRAIESFIGVIVSETNLKFNSLQKLPLFACGDHLIDRFLHKVTIDLAHET